MKKDFLLWLSKARVVVLDVDGVLMPDTETIFPDGGIAKQRSHRDGQGISLMRAVGLKIVLITGEGEDSPGAKPIKRLVKKWNNLPSSRSQANPGGWLPIDLHLGVADKGELLLKILGEMEILPEEAVVMGDDLVDLPMFKLGAIGVAPADAEVVIRERADWITSRNGGFGAVRDLANIILEAGGVNPARLPVR